MTLATNLGRVREQFVQEANIIKEFISATDKSLAGRMKHPRRLPSPEEARESRKLIKFLQRFLDGKIRNEESLSIKSKTIGAWLHRFATYGTKRRFLSEMALVYVIALQEAFLKEYLKTVLVSRKWLLKSGKTITFEEICDFGSVASLNRYLAEKKVEDVFHENIDDLAKYLEERFGLSFDSDLPGWPLIREANYRRNLIIHNRGITNKRYCLKTGHKEIGQRLNTDVGYVLGVASATIDFINFVHTKILAKLG